MIGYKWKPIEHMTIDFYICKLPNNLYNNKPYTNYKLNKLRNIDFPFVLLNLIEDLLDKINVELTVNETYTHNNVNYYF